MAETQELILEINVKDSLTKTAELRASLNELIAERQKLAETSKEGDIESIKQMEALNSSVRNLNMEYKAQQRIVDGYAKSQKEVYDTQNLSKNSIDQNVAALKALTAQYKATAGATPEMAANVKKLSDVVNTQKMAIGDSTSNIGKYKEGFVGAFQTITSSVPALKGFQTAQLGVNAAMNANPIGGVVMLLQGLFEIFSKNKAVADQVTFAIDGLSKGFGVIIDTVVDTVTNFDKLTEALRHPIDFLYNMGKASANAAIEGRNASKAIDELTETIGRNGVAIAKNNAAIEEQKTVLAKVSSGVEARKKAAQEIIKLEDENAKMLVANAQTALDAERMKLKGLTLSGEQKAKLYDLEAKVIQENSKAVTESRRAEVRLALLLGGEVVKAKKEESKQIVKTKEEEAEELRKLGEKQGELAIANERELRKFRLEQQEASLQKTLALFDLESEAKEESLRKAGATEIEITAWRNAEIERITKESLDKIAKDSAKAKEEIAKPQKETFASSIGLSEQGVNDAQSFLGQLQDAVAGVGEIIMASYEVEKNLIEQNKNEQIAAVEATGKSKEQKAKEIRAIEKKAAQEKYEAEKSAFEANKAIQIVNAIIGTAVGVINAFQLGPIAGAIFAAIIAGVGAAQIAIIATQQPPPPPKFAKGVIGLDGAGTETSDDIPAYLSKGESVVTAKATRRFHRELAEMEMAVGNTPNYQFGRGRFASGFIPMEAIQSDGGYTARDSARNSDMAMVMQNAIRDGFAMAPAPKLSIVEFETKQASRNRSVNVSES